MAADRINSPPRVWQRMLSGRRLNLLDPSPLDIEITDIAQGLARVARWNGQTQGTHAFSVAQHCVLVEHIAKLLVPELEARWCLAILLHDAPEYVIGDMISPFKNVMGGNYKVVETALHHAIHRAFGLPHSLPNKIDRLAKRADIISAYFEATLLAGFDENEAKQLFGAPKELSAIQQEEMKGLFISQSTVDAQRAFLNRFHALAACSTSDKITNEI
ncbi:YfbR-like 5'-deoxynucleotidase [Polycladidibacter stylochi]|uniref:YfbR-like 5'-deoxynucleotidase n=1 Tax=Polycladidibacter stylochi TaxID=1807766 RepID=UPI000830507B|nr:HD family hydrolase [Pseudovibrio stylochi]